MEKEFLYIKFLQTVEENEMLKLKISELEEEIKRLKGNK
jgi:hypothetical protein